MENEWATSTGADGSVAEAKRGTTVDVLAIAKDLRGKIAERPIGRSRNGDFRRRRSPNFARAVC